MDLVLANAMVASHRGVLPMDIGVKDGAVVELCPAGVLARRAGREAIDLSGLHVLPGVIDSHVHFREPGGEEREDFESGSRGAVLGGVTCVFDMPNTSPSVLSDAALQDKLARVGRHAWCDFGLYVAADGRNDAALPSLERRRGVCGVKVFMGSSTSDLVLRDPEALAGVLASGRRVVSIHAEDEERIERRRPIAEAAGDVRAHPEWRDVESALSATRRALALARAAGRRVHILHVSTAEELRLIAAHRDVATCEALPQHLTFAAPGCYETHGALVQQNPPIREARHRDALWAAVASGLVDVIGSDHGPHLLSDKAAPYPNRASGMPGTQTLLPLTLDAVARGRITLLQAVDLLSAGPARVFGVVRKGRIAEGFDADFSVVDLARSQTIRSADMATRVGWTAYDGMTVVGWPVMTIIRGRIVMRDGETQGSPVGRPALFEEADLGDA